MSKYKLEKKSVDTAVFSCEVCGKGPIQSLITIMESVNEFHKDGIVKIHYSCPSHIIDLYKQITNEIEKNKIVE